MAETTKKTKTTAAKPRKPSTQKKGTLETANNVTPINGSVSSNGSISTNGSVSIKSSVPYDEVARLAHRYFVERGGQHGHHVEDWIRAEHELLGKAS